MNVNDLRRLNLVQDESGNVQYVYRIWAGGAELSEDKDGSSDLDYHEEEIFGVPLTEEWLAKFGFKFFGKETRCAYFGSNPLTEEWLIDIRNTGYPFWFYRNAYFKLEYVHQLQNLYHSLMGEELTLKES